VSLQTFIFKLRLSQNTSLNQSERSKIVAVVRRGKKFSVGNYSPIAILNDSCSLFCINVLAFFRVCLKFFLVSFQALECFFHLLFLAIQASGLLFNFVIIFIETVGLPGPMINTKYPCAEKDWNTRSQRLSERRQYMP
jgi:hypothetical protein